MNAISPGVYTKITVLESYVEEVPSSTGFIALICDKGEDGKLQYSASREDFLKNTGNPNVNKYGKIWTHGSLIAERWMAASPSLYYIRVLPSDATYSNIAFWFLRRPNVIISSGVTDPSLLAWTEVSYINEPNSCMVGTSGASYYRYFNYEGYVGGVEDITDTDVISSNFTASNFKKLPEIYIQGVDGGTGTTYTFKMYQNNLVLVSTSATTVVEPTYILGDNGTDIYLLSANIVAAGSGGVPIPGTTLEAQVVATSVATYDSVHDSVPTRYINDYSGDHIYEIHVDNTGNVTYNDVTATYAGDAYEVIKPLYLIRGRGRGTHYNNYRVQFEIVSNLDKVYAMTVSELKSDNQYHAIGTYYIAFDPTVLDESGESMFIQNVIDNYVDDLRVYIEEDELESLRNEINLDLINNVYNSYEITDYLRASFVYNVSGIVDTLPTSAFDGTYYFVKEKASGDLYGDDGKIIRIDSTAPNGFTVVDDVDTNRIIYNSDDETYYLHVGLGKVIEYDPFVHFTIMEANEDDDLDERDLEAGSEGSLFNTSTGQVDGTIATNILTNAYNGITDPNIISTDNIWFDLVFCGGYPRDVKDAAVELAKTRQDCIAILDLDDNTTLENAIRARIETYSYNTPYAALFDPYRKVRDPFSGKDIWVSPVYHMAWLLGTNDRINEVWYAVAGFTRGMADGIKELRYDPQLSDRDRMYLNQINPTAHFKEGKVVWGQLTTQRKADALQDINIVRCILYIKRALENYCRYFEFDFNDIFTWVEIENGVIGFLKSVKEKRGLYSYSASVGADEYLRKRKAARVSVILEPTRILEKMFLDFYIK